MGVMEKLRGGTDSFLMQAILVVVVISFVGWIGVSQGRQTDVVAIVDGKRVMMTDLERGMQWVGRGAKTDAERAAAQQELLTGLIQHRVLLNEADRLGIQVSNAEIEYAVQRMDAQTAFMVMVPSPNYQIQTLNQPQMQAPELMFVEDGTYKPSLYGKWLDARGIDQGMFQSQVYEYLRVRKVLELAGIAPHIPPTELEQRYELENTQLTVRFARIPSEAFLGTIELTDVEVEAFMAASSDRIQASYDAQFNSRFDLPRKATLRTILLRTGLEGQDDAVAQANAEKILAQLQTGADFDEMARRWSEDLSATQGGAMGELVASAIDPTAIDAIFATEAGGLTGVVKTNRGLQIFLVEAREDARIISFDEAKEELAREILAADRAPAVARDFAEQTRVDWMASGSPPVESMMGLGILPQTAPPVTLAQGQIPDLGPGSDAVVSAARGAAQGDVLDQVFTIGGDLVVAQLVTRVDPDMSVYAEESATLRQRMLAMERFGFQAGYVDDLVSRAEVVRYLGAAPEAS